MALQYGGQISMGQINVELGRAYTSANTSLDAAENGSYGAINQNSASRPSGSNPAAMSEWHGYNHTAAPPTPQQFNLNLQFEASFYDFGSDGFGSFNQSGVGSNSNFYNFFGFTTYNETYPIYVGDTIDIYGTAQNPGFVYMEVYIEAFAAGAWASDANYGSANAFMSFIMPANNVTAYMYLFDS